MFLLGFWCYIGERETDKSVKDFPFGFIVKESRKFLREIENKLLGRERSANVFYPSVNTIDYTQHAWHCAYREGKETS